MIDWTDRHCRYFLRLISKQTLLYTEMITTGALLHGDAEYLLAHDPSEYPLAIQLGGSNPRELADCARLAEEVGYQEINLNVGCPSDRVQSGRFGACLMAEPELVADCVKAMSDAVSVPVTVKHRLGIDRQDSYGFVSDFVNRVYEAGCRTFIVHARSAWLDGLSPKENRDVPPLRYQMVYRLKSDFPDAEIIINGGIETLEQASVELRHLDGVMMGRAVYHNPWLLADADKEIFGQPVQPKERHEVVHAFLNYIDREMQDGASLRHMTRHILGLFHGRPGARLWRRHLSEHVHRPNVGPEIVEQALQLVSDQLDQQRAISADESGHPALEA